MKPSDTFRPAIPDSQAEYYEQAVTKGTNHMPRSGLIESKGKFIEYLEPVRLSQKVDPTSVQWLFVVLELVTEILPRLGNRQRYRVDWERIGNWRKLPLDQRRQKILQAWNGQWAVGKLPHNL